MSRTLIGIATAAAIAAVTVAVLNRVVAGRKLLGAEPSEALRAKMAAK